MSYTPRLNSDGIVNNPKWYSSNPFYTSGYGLPNCTCYAWGRFWEISDPNNQSINRPNLSLGDGDQWWGYTQDGYERGQTPKLGATICFGESHGYGTGHVAVVEEIYPNGQTIVTSNSDWQGRFFYLETLTPDSNGKYHHQGSIYLYESQGFIYNPWAEQPEPPTIEKKKEKFPWPVAWNNWSNFKI